MVCSRFDRGNIRADDIGNGAGAGMALLYVSCAIAMVSIGAFGFKLPQLRRLEDRVSEE